VKLTVFRSGDGDCLLLTSGDGHHALIDGGRRGTYREHTEPTLAAMSVAGTPLDMVVVSHIDADHISGILELLHAVAAWEVFDFQTSEAGNTTLREPAERRPPRIGKLWHNAWRAQVGELAGPIESLASTVDVALALATIEPPTPDAARMVDAMRELAVSIPDGIELLRLVEEDTPIPRNDPFEGLVLLKRQPHIEPLGTTSLTVLGPAKKHLKKLRDEWRVWLEKTGVEQAVEQAVTDPLAGEGAGDQLVQTLSSAAAIIAETDPEKVTPPNRASILLLAEEGAQTCLLTGDAAEEEIIDGLKAAGRLQGGRFRCNVLKVQHHGSENNVSKSFAEQVIADHYVFCGDGAHGNPSPSVVKTIVETRADADPDPFTLWFNCSAKRTLPSRRLALQAAIAEARRGARKHDGITVEVLGDRQSFFEIDLDHSQ
jgi:beta-lactamase superfamily II metal-dependent hydrolase